LIANRKELLEAALRQSQKDPFHFGDQYDSGDDLVPFAFGLWLEASFYDEMTNTSTVTLPNFLAYLQYQELATLHKSWIFGQNAWGTSFVVGAGALFPDCLQHQVKRIFRAYSDLFAIGSKFGRKLKWDFKC
jgi:endoglucanase